MLSTGVHDTHHLFFSGCIFAKARIVQPSAAQDGTTVSKRVQPPGTTVFSLWGKVWIQRPILPLVCGFVWATPQSQISLFLRLVVAGTAHSARPAQSVPGLASRGWPILLVALAVLAEALVALTCQTRRGAATRATVHCPALRVHQSRLSAQPSSSKPARTLNPGPVDLRLSASGRRAASHPPPSHPWVLGTPQHTIPTEKGPGLGPINHHTQSPCPPTRRSVLSFLSATQSIINHHHRHPHSHPPTQPPPPPHHHAGGGPNLDPHFSSPPLQPTATLSAHR